MPVLKINMMCSQVEAQSDVINGAWTVDGKNKGLLESIGIMLHTDTKVTATLDDNVKLVKYFADATNTYKGEKYPITVDVTINDIILGFKAPLHCHKICKMSNNYSSVLETTYLVN